MAEYFTPQSVEDALKILNRYQGAACILAGGTDLLVDHRKGKKQVTALVDITRIDDLNQIEYREGYVVVGAAVTFGMLRRSEIIQSLLPILMDAAATVGAAGIQNTATWVGNLVQAMPAADGAIAALAMEAEAQVVTAEKRVWLPVKELFSGPGKSRVEPATQLVTHLRIQVPSGKWGGAWQRTGRRSALILPTLNCAVKVELEGDIIRNAVIAMGPVAPVPFIATSAGQFLSGKLPDRVSLEEASHIARNECTPRGNPLRASAEYRSEIIPVLVRRALECAVERAIGASLIN